MSKQSSFCSVAVGKQMEMCYFIVKIKVEPIVLDKHLSDADCKLSSCVFLNVSEIAS